MSTSASLILGLAMSLIAPATNPGSPPSTVVIAELFTSEGCSSCPPADTLVRQLADAQPFDGAHLIALEEHVDYWDRLGWRDPFSSPQFTSRQTEYKNRVFRSNAIYTPQLVVDGVRECVGSDRSARWLPSASCPTAVAHSLEQWTCRLRRTGILGICRSLVSFRNATVAEFSGLAQRSVHSDRERSMKNVMCGGFVAVVFAVSAVAGAQDHKMDDKMNTMKSETSYTGCIERSPDGAITLGHAMASSTTTKKSMAGDSMAKESMAKDAMAKDAMAKDSMAHDSKMKDAMASTLALASTSVDLAKHVGHQVTVKGVAGDTMGGLATFNVKSIKMVGSSCS